MHSLLLLAAAESGFLPFRGGSPALPKRSTFQIIFTEPLTRDAAVFFCNEQGETQETISIEAASDKPTGDEIERFRSRLEAKFESAITAAIAGETRAINLRAACAFELNSPICGLRVENSERGETPLVTTSDAIEYMREEHRTRRIREQFKESNLSWYARNAGGFKPSPAIERGTEIHREIARWNYKDIELHTLAGTLPQTQQARDLQDRFAQREAQQREKSRRANGPHKNKFQKQARRKSRKR